MKNSKTVLFAAGICLISSSVFAQKSTIITAFLKHNIDTNILDPDIKQRPEDVSFDYKYTSIAAGKEKVTLAKFDATKNGDERWIVLSVNGDSPSATEISTYQKEHRKPKVPAAKTDTTTMKVEKENQDQLVISYKLDATTIPSEVSFLKDCRNYLTINLGTKKLEQLQMLSEKPVKIKIIKANKVDLNIKYIFDEKLNKYLPISEDLNIDVKFLGQVASMETISEYSNYSKK